MDSLSVDHLRIQKWYYDPASVLFTVVLQEEDLAEGLYSPKLVYKDLEEVSAFSDSQSPTQGYMIMKNQANMTSPKETNKALVTDPKAMEIHKLLDK